MLGFLYFLLVLGWFGDLDSGGLDAFAGGDDDEGDVCGGILG